MEIGRKIRRKRDNNTLKQRIKQIKLWRSRTSAENGIAQAIRANPGILTEKADGALGDTLIAEYFIKKGNEKINRAIIDAAPEMLNMYYSDFGQEYEWSEQGGLSQKKRTIGCSIAIENASLITRMLEKNNNLADDRNFIRYAIEFGSEDARKYLIDNFASKVFAVDERTRGLFASQIVNVTESMDVAMAIESKLKSFKDGLPADANSMRHFIRLEKLISKFKKGYLKKMNRKGSS